MAWRETERSKAALIRRRYRCTCGYEFRWTHASEDEPHPECPACVARGQTQDPVTWVPPNPGVLTTKSRAIDFTQKMVEQDMGLTNFKDNLKEGEAAYMPDAPMHTAEREAVTRELIQAGVPQHIPAELQGQVDNMWQGGMGAQSTEATLGAPSVAKAASEAARAAGAEPLAMLEGARSSGNLPFKLNVVARSDG